MTNNQFIAKLLEELQNSLPPEITPRLSKRTKNNGQLVDSIEFVTKGSNVSPVIYPANYYDSFIKEDSMADIVKQILSMLFEAEDKPGFNPDVIFDYEKVSEGLCLRLINRKYNEDMLRETPNIPYLDLALICVYYIKTDDGSPTYSTVVNNSLLSRWNRDKKEVFKRAMENSPRLLPPSLHTMDSFLKKSMNISLPDYSSKILILTNKYMNNGALSMVYPDILRNISQKLDSDLIIIPSSIHELILLPYDNEEDFESLNMFIKEVNEEAVDRKEWLSDHYYMYTRDDNLIHY